MGDRGNVFFVGGKVGKSFEGVYMYSHWGGGVLPAIVRAALERGKGRWGDPQYLARIIFCEMIQEDVLSETGFGLGTEIGDNEHPIVRIDDEKQRVSFHEEGNERDPKDKGIASWSYAEYLAAGDEAVLSAFSSGDDDDEDDDDDDAPAALPAAKAKVKAKPKAKAKAKKPGANKPAKKAAKKK